MLAGDVVFVDIPIIKAVITGPAYLNQFRGHYFSATDLTTYAFNNVDIGAAHPNRVVVVCILGEDALSAFTVSSLSIRGVAAAEQAESVNSGGGTSLAVIYSLAVPDGRFATVDLTFSEAVTSCAIGVFALYGVSATATDIATSTDADPTALTIDVVSGGVIIACAANSGSEVPTWSGAFPYFGIRTSENTYTGAMYQAGDTEINRAVSCDWSVSTGSEAGAAAAFA